METMVKRYEAMQADVFDSLEKEFGAKPWEVQPNSLGGGRSGCGGPEDDPEGEQVQLPPMSFTGTYPATDWDQVRDLVEEVGRKHGFDDVAHVKDEPGDLDMVGEDEYGGRYEFGMAKNTIFDLRTGCHRWDQKPPTVVLDAMTAPDPTADARQVAVELARMVARVSARGDLPRVRRRPAARPGADGALAILLDSADTVSPHRERPRTGPARPSRRGTDHLGRPGQPLARCGAAGGVAAAPPRGRRELLARDEILDALVGGPRRPRLDRALVRVLQAVAPLRSPATVATVVRRLGRPGVDLDRLAHGVTALLVECFDDLAGLSLGVDAWTSCPPMTWPGWSPAARASRGDEPALHPVRGARARPDAGRAGQRPDHPGDSLGQAVQLFSVLAPQETGRTAGLPGRGLEADAGDGTAAVARPPTGGRADRVADAWAGEVSGPEQGERLPVGRLDRPRLEHSAGSMDQHGMLPVPEPTPV